MTRWMIRAALVPAVAALAACGGGDEDDPADIPGVDASGTADTELFTPDPDPVGVPTAAEGGTMADSVVLGTPGTEVADSTAYGTEGASPP